MTRWPLALAGAALAAALLLPLVPLAIWAFARGWRFPDLVPGAWTLAGWQAALAPRSGLVEALGLTLAIALSVTLLAVLIGVPAGRAIGLHRFPGRRAVVLLILAPLLVPAVAVALGLHDIFIRLGLTNSAAGVILAHLVPAVPYMVLVMAAAFTRLDPDLEAQARSLGASRWQVLRHVTLPAVRPGLIAGGLFVFLVSWGQYLLTLLIGGGRVITLPLLLNAFAGSGRNDIAGAVAIVTILPGLLIVIFTARAVTGAHVAIAGTR
jgi:putative spermidine/putrescine transport system permease protein